MTTTRRLTSGLTTPHDKVEKLQNSLHAKAKAEPSYRFYSLWDKIYRGDVLAVAYGRCAKNGGAPGIDGETFADIEEQGCESWLRKLEEELRKKEYRPQPLRRVWIPKASGGERPLGIAMIRDRVVQMAATLILSPIFEVDLHPNQYGFRSGLDAKLAIRRVFFHITQHQRTEVVDADLSDYFNSVPHGQLVKCLARRIADGCLLSVIKAWLEMPAVEERKGPRGATRQRTTEAKDKHRGTPQGSPISPLFSNVYFRRFMLAWHRFGYAEDLDARVVNYADDFVICTRPGNGEEVMEKMRTLMSRLGLQVNERKTRLAKLPGESFDFLGYTVGRFYSRGGRAFIGTCPSRKSVRRVIQKIHEETSPKWLSTTAEKRVLELNRIIRGWANYFDQGPVLKIYRKISIYTERRLQKWLVRKHKQRGPGYRQYPEKYLYEKLGLFKLPRSRTNLLSAKACHSG